MQDLEKDIKGDTSGNFATFLKALVRQPEDRDSHFLMKCLKVGVWVVVLCVCDKVIMSWGTARFTSLADTHKLMVSLTSLMFAGPGHGQLAAH